MSVRVEDLTTAENIADDDKVMITHASGETETITGADLKSKWLKDYTTDSKLNDTLANYPKNINGSFIEDCNSFSFGSGSYNTDNGSSGTPPNSNYGTIMAYNSQGYTTQIAQDIQSGTMFIRKNLYGTWSNWEELVNSTDLYNKFGYGQVGDVNFNSIKDGWNIDLTGLSNGLIRTINNTDGSCVNVPVGFAYGFQRQFKFQDNYFMVELTDMYNLKKYLSRYVNGVWYGWVQE